MYLFVQRRLGLSLMGTYPSLMARIQQKACVMDKHRWAGTRGSKEEKGHVEGYVGMSQGLREAQIAPGSQK
jgi:hypothetical protein